MSYRYVEEDGLSGVSGSPTAAVRIPTALDSIVYPLTNPTSQTSRVVSVTRARLSCYVVLAMTARVIEPCPGDMLKTGLAGPGIATKPRPGCPGVTIGVPPANPDTRTAPSLVHRGPSERRTAIDQ